MKDSKMSEPSSAGSPGRKLSKAGAQKLDRPSTSNRGGLKSSEKRINNRAPQYRSGGKA
jgi:hypothetical protein